MSVFSTLPRREFHRPFATRIETDYSLRHGDQHHDAQLTIDCRQIPSDKHCTLAISGAEEEVLDLAVIHAIILHGRHELS